MKKFVFLITAILFLTSINFAQGLSIGPELGYYKAQDAENGSVLFGAQARLKLSKLIGIEGAIDYRKEKYSGGDVEVTTYPVQATALIYPIPLAYGAIGAGWYNTNVTVHTALGDYDDTSQEFGYHFGGGVELPLNKNISLAGDIRYVFLNYDFEKVPGQEVDANFYVIKVGLLINLQ